MASKYRYTATYLTDEARQYLELYSLVYEINKTELIRSIINQWINDNSHSKQDLIKLMINKINKEWNTLQVKQQASKTGQHLTKQQFLHEMKVKYNSQLQGVIEDVLALCGYEAD